jgi:hypothetical protein
VKDRAFGEWGYYEDEDGELEEPEHQWDGLIATGRFAERELFAKETRHDS